MSIANCCLDDGLEGEVLLDPALLPGALHDGARPHQRQPVLGVLQWWQGGHQIFGAVQLPLSFMTFNYCNPRILQLLQLHKIN